MNRSHFRVSGTGGVSVGLLILRPYWSVGVCFDFLHFTNFTIPDPLAS